MERRGLEGWGLDEGAIETNFILGEHPSDSEVLLFTGVGVALGWVVLKYIDDPEIARTVIWIGSIFTGYYVYHNWKVVN